MLDEINFIRDLSGFSGCKVKLYKHGKKYFVRKISKSREYNKRLQKQTEKQKSFAEYTSNSRITAPKVLDEGFIHELYFFDMDYVQGITLVEHINNSGTEGLLKIAQDLYFLINFLKKIPVKRNPIDFSKSFKEKIVEIKYKINHLDHGVKLLEELESLTSKLIDIRNVFETFCHGDLTMENIIYDKENDRYYLIDFLDNFINHYWFDITKLFQDIEGRWYKFRTKEINLQNISPKMDFIGNFFKIKLMEDDKTYLTHHPFLLSVNFARILPYASQEDTGYLFNIIQENLSKISSSLI